jgi:hypothetical protein
MRFPIDTSRLQFLVVGEAEPLRKFEADKPRERWAPRVDDNGEVLWRVQVVALGLGEAEIIRVAVPGEPGVREGESVTRGGPDGAAVGERRALGHLIPGGRDQAHVGSRGEGGRVTVRVAIDLGAAGRVDPAPFLDDRGRPVAWVEIDGPGRAGVYGSPTEMRELAAAATAAADQAEEMRRVGERLVETGMVERLTA